MQSGYHSDWHIKKACVYFISRLLIKARSLIKKFGMTKEINLMSSIYSGTMFRKFVFHSFIRNLDTHYFPYIRMFKNINITIKICQK